MIPGTLPPSYPFSLLFYSDIIITSPPCFSIGVDKYKWMFELSRKFSLLTFFSLLMFSTFLTTWFGTPFYLICFLFIWKLTNKFLLIDSVWQKLGFQLTSCCHCRQGSDSIDHIFFTCPYAFSLWSQASRLLELFQIPWSSFHTAHDFVFCWWSFARANTSSLSSS